MKRKLLSSAVFTFFTLAMVGQTLVSTSPENKKTVLEEFTGIHCTFCPDGHAIAQEIQDNNPDEVFLVNIHTGGYANPGNGEPDFRTPFGSAIGGQSGLVGYPAGTVNRTNFPGMEQGASGTTAMSRGSWSAASNITLNEASYVNVGVEATIDMSANELIVHVEAYYTGDSPESTNLFNIALLQNNTLGPQTGGGQGNNYNHMHRLVHMITGQWGETIANTTEGSLYDETFTYTIPADYNDVPVVLQDLEIVVFVTETQQGLISGNGTYPTFTNLPLDNDTNVVEVEEVNDQCGLDFGPRVVIQNNGNNLLTSVDFEYSINSGTPGTYTWNGSLGAFEEEIVQLPGIPYTIESTNTVSVSISDDDDNTNNEALSTFGETDVTATSQFTMILNTDDNGSETTWFVKDPSGQIIASGGPYDNNDSINEEINVPTEGCHEFRLIDAGGNGSGSVVVYDSNSEVIYNSPGNYGSGAAASFIVNELVLANNDNILNGVIIYPNPASSVLNIENAENSSIEIYDLLGRVILSENNISLNKQLNVSSFSTGTYLIKISNNGQVKTDKFIINR
tara:strand:+ start:24403 stop:26097 length:1695 start_codon:yes stop_codon:yes gene_type:complete